MQVCNANQTEPSPVTAGLLGCQCALLRAVRYGAHVPPAAVAWRGGGSASGLVTRRGPGRTQAAEPGRPNSIMYQEIKDGFFAAIIPKKDYNIATMP